MFVFVSQKMEAAYYDNIIEQQRIEPEFFKMGFYGRKFPFFLRVEVSPLENAIYVVENKTQELRTLISQYQHRQHHGNINSLSMCLNGVIDAAVNGGIARYQEVPLQGRAKGKRAFFDKDYISSHPEDTERITHLKDLMQELVRLNLNALVESEMLWKWKHISVNLLVFIFYAIRCTFLEWGWLFMRNWCIQKCVLCTKSLWTSST
ncbi:hypothetical protein GOODEAATRI_016264 [Goodea atripinnis]|uniref:DOCKER domain-containing protein n=1 Tax=Goodea atripinnis TaxID=208336 RepID=A0ABV0MIA0_9TELE